MKTQYRVGDKWIDYETVSKETDDIIMSTQLSDEEKIKRLERIISETRYLGAYNGLGTFYADRNNRDLAMETYRRGIKDHPEAAILYSNLASVLRQIVEGGMILIKMKLFSAIREQAI